ncbi:MAG: 4-hydroxy-tetrahydrodipicolinate reductase [Halanaerobiaceae bacterium]|nr:4-hydroxy-tetrahydrodipicolinate reductase [Halanaerobiaceae bacterium]
MKKKVIVNGACGRMGQEVVKTIVLEREEILVGVCDRVNAGKNIMDLLALDAEELIINDDLEKLIRETGPDVIIDFTIPTVIMENIRIGLTNGVNMIVGTTGITEVDLENIEKMARDNKANILIAPNFALGAVLMMQFAAEAAKYFSNVEIIELHHDQKVDSPSGTAIKTAELLNQKRDTMRDSELEEIEKISGARGADAEGVKIHSVRLPGLVAHQEVIFGGEGQTLLIRHDSYNRKSFMPGVKLALDKIDQISGLVYGLEHLLD